MIEKLIKGAVVTLAIGGTLIVIVSAPSAIRWVVQSLVDLARWWGL